MRTPVFAIAALMICRTTTFAATCQDYPNSEGINVETVSNGIKVVSTSAAAVLMDDVDSIRDARTEATLQAKAEISKFLSEGVQSADVVDKAVQETKSMQGSSKSALRREVVDRLTHLSSVSAALLRGVIVLGECYTPGREVRVSVGLKPETLQAAGNLSDHIDDGLPNGSPPVPVAQPLNGVDGFSHSDALKKF